MTKQVLTGRSWFVPEDLSVDPTAFSRLSEPGRLLGGVPGLKELYVDFHGGLSWFMCGTD